MLAEVTFRRKKYKLIITQHALERMVSRNISRSLVLEIIETGKPKAKKKPCKWWIYKSIKGRSDNSISLSISIEDPHLIVITTLVEWRPK